MTRSKPTRGWNGIIIDTPTYYVGRYSSYLLRVQVEGLDKRVHRFLGSIETAFSLHRSMLIKALSPLDSGHWELIRELKLRGFKVELST